MSADLKHVKSIYGGYWKYKINDFCYLVNPYFPTDKMIKEMKKNMDKLIRNYPSTNITISETLSNTIKIPKENIAVANGASELIAIFGQLFVKSISVYVPTFDEYINRLKIQNKKVHIYETIDNDFQLNLDDFIRSIKTTKSNTALLIRPNNPTGMHITKKDAIYCLEKLSEVDHVIVDESFVDMVTIESNTSIEDQLKTFDNLVIIKSLSKSYGTPGLRLGYLLANKDITSVVRTNLPIWNINSFSQFFLEIFDKYKKDFFQSCKKMVEVTNNLYNNLLNISYITPYPTQANFILCKLNGYTSAELSAILFKKYNILVNDSSSKKGLDNRFIRISSRTEEENQTLVATLKKIGEKK